MSIIAQLIITNYENYLRLVYVLNQYVIIKTVYIPSQNVRDITAFISSFVYVVVSAVAWRLAAWRCKTLGKPFRGGVNPKGNHVAFWLNIELTYSQRMTHSAIEDLILLRTSLCM